MPLNDYDWDEAAINGFQLGKEVAGPNALGVMIQGVMGRINQAQDTNMAARAKAAYDPELQAKSQALQHVQSESTLPRPEGGYNQAEMDAGVPEYTQSEERKRFLSGAQDYGLLPKQPLSMADILAIQGQGQSSSSPTAPTQPGMAAPKSPFTPNTESSLNPTKLFLGQVFLERQGRKLGRAAGMRESVRGLTESYASRTAEIGKSLGDTGNFAVSEREIIQQSFPADDDSYESRLTKERSINSIFDVKEAQLTEIANQEVPMKLIGTSRYGARYQQDPAALEVKKKALDGLSRLKQARAAYQQMYEEANRIMPPIGGKIDKSGGNSIDEDPYAAEARRRGLI